MDKNVLLYGGAFDPPHIGHKLNALRALEYMIGKKKMAFDLWFLPCYSDAFGNKSLENSTTDRLAMLNILVFDVMRALNVGVCSYELEMANKAGTYAVVQGLRKEYPNVNFYYLIGFDQAIRIRRWRNSRDLLKTIPFVTTARSGVYNTTGATWYNNAPHTFISTPVPSANISSTDIRMTFALMRGPYESGGTIHKHLDKPIQDYIIQNNLYMGASK